MYKKLLRRWKIKNKSSLSKGTDVAHYKKISLICISLAILFLPAPRLWSEPVKNKVVSVRTIPVTGMLTINNPEQFDQAFKTFMEKWQFPGATVAIIHKNHVIINRGYGWSNIENRTAMQPSALFRIGSVSKTITAITILYLDQLHKLSLHDPIFKLLSDVAPLPGQQKAQGVEGITIHHLLQMSAGWYMDRPQDYDPMVGPWSDTMLKQLNYSIPPSCENAARVMISQPLEFKPGSHFSYSNFNYCLLGLAINQVTNSKDYLGYESYVKQILLTPLGITQMRIGSTDLNEVVFGEVHYYAVPPANVYGYIDRELDGLPYGNTELLKKNSADGGWIASAIDLAKLLQALFQRKILDDEHFNLMVTPQSFAVTTLGKNDWKPALGWDEVGEINGHHFYLKTGSFTGTQAVIILTDEGTSYAALFNTKAQDYSAFVKELKEILFAVKVS